MMVKWFYEINNITIFDIFSYVTQVFGCSPNSFGGELVDEFDRVDDVTFRLRHLRVVHCPVRMAQNLES